MKPTKRHRRRPGRRFTLIELLLVTTIIAILISMILPALSRAKAKGKQAKCANRLKQWAIAFNYYATDREGFMVFDEEDPARPEDYWHQKLRPEVSDLGPVTEAVKFTNDPGMAGAFAYTGNDESHYLYNAQVNGMRLVQAVDTEKTLLLFDGSNKVRIGGADNADVGNLLSTVILTFPHPANRSNILSLDGHVYVLDAGSAVADADNIFWNPKPAD